MGSFRTMNLPFKPLYAEYKGYLTQQKVREVDTHREGEPLKTGGWVCYTVRNYQQKIAKNNRHNDRYISRKAISSNLAMSSALLGQSFYG